MCRRPCWTSTPGFRSSAASCGTGRENLRCGAGAVGVDRPGSGPDNVHRSVLLCTGTAARPASAIHAQTRGPGGSSHARAPCRNGLVAGTDRHPAPRRKPCDRLHDHAACSGCTSGGDRVMAFSGGEGAIIGDAGDLLLRRHPVEQPGQPGRIGAPRASTAPILTANRTGSGQAQSHRGTNQRAARSAPTARWRAIGRRLPFAFPIRGFAEIKGGAAARTVRRSLRRHPSHRLPSPAGHRVGPARRQRAALVGNVGAPTGPRDRRAREMHRYPVRHVVGRRRAVGQPVAKR